MHDPLTDPTHVWDFDAEDPRLAIRRHTDRCFFAVEELVPGPGARLAGFVVEGHLISPDEVAEVRRLDAKGPPACHPSPARSTPPTAR